MPSKKKLIPALLALAALAASPLAGCNSTVSNRDPIGERFPLEFTLPGSSERIVCMVEVAWVRHPDAQDELRHGMPGLGLRFAGISGTAEAAIRRFTEAREALFFPEFDEHDA